MQQNLPNAVWFISQIRHLYQIEDEARELVPSERHVFRRQQVPAIWEAIKARAVELQPRFLSKSMIGGAIRYFLDEHDALTGYLRNGRYEIDNNLCSDPTSSYNLISDLCPSEVHGLDLVRRDASPSAAAF